MKPIGVWILGAYGSIATVMIASIAAIKHGYCGRFGLVTERPEFADVDLASLGSLVFGGHETRDCRLQDNAKKILAACGLQDLYGSIKQELEEVGQRIRPGIVSDEYAPDKGLATGVTRITSDISAIRNIKNDLDMFKEAVGVSRIIVVNLASTESVEEPKTTWDNLSELEAALAAGQRVLPASSLYAYAALSAGDAYVNFTPSLGSRIGALVELAETKGAVHAGADGKTGETLVKSVLAELFVRRNLHILSWFGQNILGNNDGLVLAEPQCKAAKIKSKDSVLKNITGYPLETTVGIDYVESLGEWKVAWDYIHFEGFLGSKMNLQFTWSGCDSLLAAPLVIDLVRLCDLAQRRNERGILGALAPFFKDPLGSKEQRLVAQDTGLLDWVGAHAPSERA
ncbi:MAG: inositol-3-phosphate synthase [Solidesulfovibrio sp. DCME]|uniref:inositol-3-phosphate synthase n=1 Tax=Solidesulfovibrio sp. DCME TaxID=3447380 RepID=UPI003D0A8BD0